MAKQVAEEFGADLGAFAYLHDDGDEVVLVAGYNLGRESPIEATSVPRRQVPRLAEAMVAERPLRLVADDRLPELSNLSKALHLSFQSNVLAVPLSNMRSPAHWAVLLLKLAEAWKAEAETKLDELSFDLNERLASAIEVANETDIPQVETSEEAESAAIPPQTEESASMDDSSNEDTQEAAPSEEPASTWLAKETGPFATLRAQLRQVEEENQHYRQDVERLLAHIDEMNSAQPQAAHAEQSNELVEALRVENQRLRDALTAAEDGPGSTPAPGTSSLESKQAREELRLALEEVTRLQEDLNIAQQVVLGRTCLP